MSIQDKLIKMASLGELDQCADLIARGADVNYADDSSETALYNAVQLGHLDICKLLLAHGARVNEYNGLNEDSQTCLTI